MTKRRSEVGTLGPAPTASNSRCSHVRIRIRILDEPARQRVPLKRASRPVQLLPQLLDALPVVGGPKDSGTANYQIAVSVCSTCGQGAMRANGEDIPVSPEVIEWAECDAQVVELDQRPHVGPAPRATQQIPPALAAHLAAGRALCSARLPPLTVRPTQPG